METKESVSSNSVMVIAVVASIIGVIVLGSLAAYCIYKYRMNKVLMTS